MRFAIIAERRYLSQRMPWDLLAPLKKAGHEVDVICSDDEVCDFRAPDSRFVACDAAISRDRSLLGLLLLAWAEKAGIPAVNSREAIEGVRNKAEMTATLAAAGIPMPETVVCGSLHQLRQLPPSFFPLILKPIFGDNGKDIQLVSADEIARVKPCDGSMILAQKFVPNDGFDIKLYVAGERVWAVRKPNLWSHGNGGEAWPMAVDDEMRSLALRCGRALELEAYGVDALPSPGGIQVLEVNEFPNYTGIPEAPEAVGQLLIAKAAERRRNGLRPVESIPAADGVGSQ